MCVCVFTAKRRERERRMGGVTVPPPRPAFPRVTEVTSQSGPSSRSGGGGDEKRREKVRWTRLEQQEDEEREMDTEERVEERGEDMVERGERREGGEAVCGEEKKTVPTIRFKHTAEYKTSLTKVSRYPEEIIVLPSQSCNVCDCSQSVWKVVEGGQRMQLQQISINLRIQTWPLELGRRRRRKRGRGGRREGGRKRGESIGILI